MTETDGATTKAKALSSRHIGNKRPEKEKALSIFHFLQYVQVLLTNSPNYPSSFISFPLNQHSWFLMETQEEEEEREKCYRRYRDMTISTLPREKGWLTENIHEYQNFWYHPKYGIEGSMFVQDHFKSQPTDILLISSPKSGTTWLKALIFSTVNRFQYHHSTHPLLTKSPHDCVPSLELQLYRTPSVSNVENRPPPRLFGTHIPFSSLPESILSSGCRSVYICRNPKDVFVSLWHFMARLRVEELQVQPIPLQEAFELFCRGVSPFGPFWDHVLGYWKASLEWPNKILFLKYEDLKREPLVHTKRLAEFLGYPFSSEEEREGVLKEILKLCSFDNLSNLEVNKTGKVRERVTNDVFFREGKVGNYGNHLTPQMIDCLDRITKTKFEGYDLSF